MHCERDHFDIAVQLPQLRLLFVIENKVDASEGDNQLTKYRLRAQQRYPDYQFMGCFLTPDGYEGGDTYWGTLSYATVAAEIRTVLTETTLSAEVLVALNHYVDLIERKIVTSQALIDACREIYRTHKSAFDLVMEHGQQSLLALAFDEFVATNPQMEATATRSETVFFLRKDWQAIPGALVADRKRWTTQFPVLFWFQLGEKKLQLRLEIGPLISELVDSRAELVQRFRSAYATNGSKASPTYTRVLTTSEKLPEDPTMDDVLTAMNELWRKWDTNHGGPRRVDEIVRDWAQGLPAKPVNH